LHRLTVQTTWEEVFAGPQREALEAILATFLPARRWFGGKARTIRSVELAEAIPLSGGPLQAYTTLLRVDYTEGDPQTYVLPLTFASGDQADRIRADSPQAALADLHIEANGSDGLLYDASSDEEFATALLEAIKDNRRFGTLPHQIDAWPTEFFEEIYRLAEAPLEPKVSQAEQSNTSVIYGRSFILKLFRRLEEGTSPDLEIGRFLSSHAFRNSPPLAGAIEYHREQGESITLAILQGFVPNQGDAWAYTLQSLDEYFNRANDLPSPPRGEHVFDLVGKDVPAPIAQAMGDYLNSARLLGRRTAELHLTLASDPADSAFAPEPFTKDYQGEMYASIEGLMTEAFRLLDTHAPNLPADTQSQARAIIESRDDLLNNLRPFTRREISALRTRCHGDYHLGQVLYTGDDFMIIDFEGEPVRALAERRRKHSPLKDVAGMLRSFHYAAYSALFSQQERTPNTDTPHLEALADNWHPWVSAAYLDEYLTLASQSNFLPTDPPQLHLLLDAYLLEKAVYELIYELNNRPDWVRIPLQGVRRLVG
jgi:maltose alpha-D-glucosyltransferase/alpha-amylase